LNVSSSARGLYSDDENTKEKKIANRIVDFSSEKKKLTGEKLKVKGSKIKYKVIMPGDSKKTGEI
jgi:hypothetical protein